MQGTRQPRHWCCVRGHFHAGAGRRYVEFRRLSQRRAHAVDYTLLQCGRRAGRAGHRFLRRGHSRHGDQVSSGQWRRERHRRHISQRFPGFDRRGISGPFAGCRRQRTRHAQAHPDRDFLVQSSGGRGICHGAEAGGRKLWHSALLRRQRFEVHQCARRQQIRSLSHRARCPGRHM